ncbi:MAG: type II toxin-antitoxin system VapC family toxin [Propionibacteriales bacterium]|nr:type II toxin-antitoxin system VapC family toxin [Propionibacteriales bacterium]
MKYLLDTNVISELRKRRGVAESAVLDWATQQPVRDLYISVVTILEIELGIAKVERRDRRQGAALRDWMDSGVLAGFKGRILPVDVDVAIRAARLHVPDPRPERDAYIAATAIRSDLTLVTRNIKDFSIPLLRTLNPWPPNV